MDCDFPFCYPHDTPVFQTQYQPKTNFQQDQQKSRSGNMSDKKKGGGENLGFFFKPVVLYFVGVMEFISEA